MKWLLAIALMAALALPSGDVLAKGGFSSGGRGFSGGGFRSSGSSIGSRSYSSPRSTTTVTRNTIINRSYGGGYGGYYHPMMMYPGFGMGYGYSNGLIEGLIIGNLMHPQGTTVYSGGGYGGQALLYPDGRVVDQNGYQVGTYANGQFQAVQNGQMVAQPAPANPQQQVTVVENTGNWAAEVLKFLGWCIVVIVCICAFLFVFACIGSLIGWASSATSVETVTETTTHHYHDDRRIEGKLKRHRQGSQYYVIDPADNSKTYVNDKDDMYEDAADRIWRLV